MECVCVYVSIGVLEFWSFWGTNIHDWSDVIVIIVMVHIIHVVQFAKIT